MLGEFMNEKIDPLVVENEKQVKSNSKVIKMMLLVSLGLILFNRYEVFMHYFN